jgi:membrane-bound serine protease (ClpP class)
LNLHLQGRRIIFAAFITFIALLSFVNASETYPISKILRLKIQSSINPATMSYLKTGFKKAQEENFNLILIEMNTPGGLVTTTKEILTLIGESEIPSAVWIRPEGASATSAGAIIASGAHLLFMSEGTNIGAATPIQMSGDIDKKSDARKKAINDLVALVQSLSEARNRNAVLFGEMIEKAASFKAQEAKEKNLINDIVNTDKELFLAISAAKGVKIKGQEKALTLTSPVIIDFEMDLGQKLLNIFANPSTAYILFLIGAALLYLEFQAPGGFVAGAVGALCLLMAGIGFQVLPLNFGALGLMVLSFALFMMEIYITSYGILSLAGLASLVAGSLFLFRTDDAYLSLSHSLIFSVVLAIVSFIAIVVYLMVKERKNIGKEKFNDTEGEKGVVIKFLKKQEEGFLYQIKVHGEVWSALSEEELAVGAQIQTSEKRDDSMILRIRRI